MDPARRGRPFKRIARLIDTLPIGVTVFPGTGIQDNLADKAKQLGIPVWRFTKDGVTQALSSHLAVIRLHRRRTRDA